MEEMLPPQTAEGAGFEPPRVRQFTIFLENRVGRLQMLVRTLEERGHHICALSVQETADTGLVRVVCSDAENARETLRESQFAFSESELIAVSLKPKGSTLIGICSALLAAEINIHYAYPLMLGPMQSAALALHVEDHETAVQTLEQQGFTVLSEADIRE